jgi:hypothetical protein
LRWTQRSQPFHDHCPSVAAAKLKKSSCWAVARIARGRVFRELHGIRYGRQPVFPANCPSFTGRAEIAGGVVERPDHDLRDCLG